MGCSLDVTSEESESSVRNQFYTKMNEMGCQPLNEPCNPFVLLQLSTSNRAKQCYCNNLGCNEEAEGFKVAIGGYLVIIFGTVGIFGNALAFSILFLFLIKKNVQVIWE